MVGNQSKPRCYNCKNLLVKGKIVGGIVLIECDTCGRVNSLAVRDDKLAKLENELVKKRSEMLVSK